MPTDRDIAPWHPADSGSERLDGDVPTGAHTIPLWNQPTTPVTTDPSQSHRFGARVRARWHQVAGRFRRPRLVLAAVACVLVLCMVLGITALGNAFLSGTSSARGGVSAHSATSAASGKASPSAGHATPRATAPATATPQNTQPPTPLTLAFTCASGVNKGTGKICVHTLPHASLSLAVRYCDGSYAKGKAFHGANSADASGNYTFSWTVSTTCVGTATATVTAKSAGQTVTHSTTFTISR